MIILISVFTLLLVYYVFFLAEIMRGLKKVSHEKLTSNNKEFISVIVPFRNEEKNILNSLHSINKQTLDPNRFEILYVDDNSDDNSIKLLEKAPKSNNIFILKSPVDLEEKAHKKLALSYAIKKAKGDIIITTDADCIQDRDWLKTMVSYFDKNTAFVSGPVEFISDGTLFGELQKIEFSSLILIGAGLVESRTPIICNAANLGFRKDVYEEVGGYKDNLNLSSGDDEFLMQKIHRETDYKIKFCFEKKAFSYTSPNKTINQFYQQRKRWASKGFHYVDKLIVIKLILIFLFYVGIPTQILLGIFLNSFFFSSPFPLPTSHFLPPIGDRECGEYVRLW